MNIHLRKFRLFILEWLGIDIYLRKNQEPVTLSFACLLLKTIKFPTEKGELFLYLYGNLYICAQKVFIVINTLQQYVFVMANIST